MNAANFPHWLQNYYKVLYMKYLLFFCQILIIFVFCSCKSAEKSIRERSFELNDIFGHKASITFKEDGTLHGFSGVNRFFGNYKLEGSKISFSGMGSTRMAGAPDAMRFEDKFMKALSQADRCSLLGNSFTLYKGEIPLLTLKSAE